MKTSLLYLSALLVCALSWTVESQQASAQGLEFDIPAQGLASALAEFAATTNLQVLYSGELTRGLRTPGIAGRYEPEEAIKLLLKGSGLEYRFTDSNTITLVQAPVVPPPPIRSQEQRPSSSPETQQSTKQKPVKVPEIVVKDVKQRETAEIGNLPPEYPGGQVASGGRVGMLGNRNIMDTPFNQTIYTQKTIQNQQARTLADVLDNDPSVRREFPGGSGIDQATIRGFLFGNQDIAFGGLYGIAPTSNGMMAVESIERVEVLKGPNALLNGIAPFGSIGGAINIVPKRAGEQPTTQFTPSYYSDSQFGGHIDIGRRFGVDDSFGVRFNGVYRNGDTAIDRQSQETRVAALGLDFHRKSVRLSADIGYQFQDTDVTRRPLTVAPGVPVPDAPKSSSNYSQPWTFQENENTYGALRGEVDIVKNTTAFAAVGGGLLRHKNLSENLSVRDTQGTITGNPAAVRIREDTVTAEIGLRSSVATGFVRHELVLSNTLFRKETGSAFQLATIPASNLFNPIFASEPSFAGLPSPGDAPKVSEQKLSSFAFADTLSVLDRRIQLTLGLRYQEVKVDNFDRVTGNRTSTFDKSALTPAVGLIVKPLEYLSLYGNYIEGLSQGPTAPVGTVNAGEIFPPFVSKQYEAGVKIDLGSFATTLSVFQISQPSAFTNPTTNVFGVDGEQRNRGVELLAFGEVTEGIRILGGVTLIDSSLTKTQGGINQGNDGIAAPSVQANFGGEWDVPFLRGLTLSARGIYTSSQFLNAANTQELPSWSRLDLGARYVIKIGSTSIIVRANVENVFDENYWASASRGFLGLSTPRTFFLSTTFSF